MRRIELYGTEVIPRVRAELAAYYAADDAPDEAVSLAS